MDGASQGPSGIGVMGSALYSGVGVYGRGGSNAASGTGVEGVAGTMGSVGVAGYGRDMEQRSTANRRGRAASQASS